MAASPLSRLTHGLISKGVSGIGPVAAIDVSVAIRFASGTHLFTEPDQRPCFRLPRHGSKSLLNRPCFTWGAEQEPRASACVTALGTLDSTL